MLSVWIDGTCMTVGGTKFGSTYVIKTFNKAEKSYTCLFSLSNLLLKNSSSKYTGYLRSIQSLPSCNKNDTLNNDIMINISKIKIANLII